MKNLLRAALAAVVALGLAVPAAAQTIDFVARGLSIQAQQRDAIPGVWNYKDDYLVHYFAACAKVRAGSGGCKVAIVGDSTAAGWGAETSGSTTPGARVNSWPTFLAKALTARGLPATVENVFGTGAIDTSPDTGSATPAGYTAAYTAYDPRLTFTGGSGSWTTSPHNIPGGGWWAAPAGTTQVMSFTPAGQVSRFEIVYPLNAGLGGFTTQIDTDTAQTISANGTAGMGRSIIDAASGNGTHTLKITPLGGNTGTIWIHWIEAYNNVTPQVSIANMGYPGSPVSSWVDSSGPWYSYYSTPFYKADLYIVELGINDWKDAGTGLAAFQSNYQTLITNLKNAGGDVLLVVPFPSSTARVSVAQQNAYSQIIYNLAKSNGCVLVDLTKRFGSYALQTSVPSSQYNDALHPKATIYANAAQIIAGVLTR